MRKFHLSVVATARNDNHGGNFLYRMQHFIDGFVEQCKRHQLNAELIIVEWNPPPENEPLYKALKFPDNTDPCAIRFIRVPPEVHMRLQHSDKLPLFQMIAKNVGIRRALGEFVLATNIDILFSDQLICYLRDRLKSNRLYRVDRLDIPAQLPSGASFDEILHFCQQNYFRINGKYGTLVKVDGKWVTNRRRLNFAQYSKMKKLKKTIPRKILFFILNELKNIINVIAYNCELFAEQLSLQLSFKLHSNACGDFTLLSHSDWEKLQGYPEWEMFSWHIDSVFLYQVIQARIKEIDLPRTKAIYHIEHSLGSGYTYETSDELFKRLRKMGIPYLRDEELVKIAAQACPNKVPLIYNSANWGMSDLTLEEIWINS